MTERISKLRDFTRDRKFAGFRKAQEASLLRCSGSEQKRQAELFKLRCAEELPIVLRDERISFARSRGALAHLAAPDPLTAQWLECKWNAGLFKLGKVLSRFRPGLAPCRKSRVFVHNTTVDYDGLLKQGLSARVSLAKERMEGAKTREEREFLSCAVETMEALLVLVGRYASEAARVGNDEMAEILKRVPAEPPRSFHDALQFVRICNFAQYLAGMAHCGLGRMDQYLFPYFKADMENGRISRVEAHELLCEFFISLNRDSDLYPGVQQGDNGQSVMLGGCLPESGESAVNDLTYMMLEASAEVRLIDPKINLRIDRNTPIDLLELGSRLTACGLGFPQYSNDDVVIPALVGKGYSLEDARNYSVAACWEFVIPGKAADLPNIGAVSFPYAVDAAFRREMSCGSFSEMRFRAGIKKDIARQVKNVMRWRRTEFIPHPFLSSLFDGALEARRDFSAAAKYRFVGIHGAGGANAADAMSAIVSIHAKKGFAGLKELLVALDRNFEGCGGLHEYLVNDAPKVGASSELADGMLKFLFDAYADVAQKYPALRPGSGSAMYYIWLVDARRRPKNLVEPVVGATAEGRRRDAPLGASLAPSHEAKVRGVMSVFRSFADIDFSRIMNGGPVTIELDSGVFSSHDGFAKLGQLIKYFVALGGHQLQLNVLDARELEDAKVHPERHRNLIVRVWGWSGYFVELAPEYQDQIIKRHTYGI